MSNPSEQNRTDDEEVYQLMVEEARRGRGEGLFVLPHITGSGAPHRDPNARGTFFGMRPFHSRADLLRAAFPGGSITGAPKVRAMEIIAELEPTARGPYCGSLGYVGFDGAMDLSILIRTVTAGRGWWQMPVGGGIVAQSDPQREYEETWHKARGLIRAMK